MAGKRKSRQDAEVGTLGRFGQSHLMGSMAKGFSTDWGPVGFSKAKHPLSIMVRLDCIQCSCWYTLWAGNESGIESGIESGNE